LATNKAAALAKFLKRKLNEPGGAASLDPALVERAVDNAKATALAGIDVYFNHQLSSYPTSSYHLGCKVTMPFSFQTSPFILSLTISVTPRLR
jgi:hypothetical protein